MKWKNLLFSLKTLKKKNEIKLIDLIIVEIYDLREENFICMICYDMIW